MQLRPPVAAVEADAVYIGNIWREQRHKVTQALLHLIAGFQDMGWIVLGEFAFNDYGLNQRQVIFAHGQRQLQQIGAGADVAAVEPVQEGIDGQQLCHARCLWLLQGALNRGETDDFADFLAVPNHGAQ